MCPYVYYLLALNAYDDNWRTHLGRGEGKGTFRDAESLAKSQRTLGLYAVQWWDVALHPFQQSVAKFSGS